MAEAGLDLTKMSEAGSPSALSPRGLFQAEAAARLLAEGPNELPGRHRRTALRIFLEVLREPMFALLLAATIYLALGDLKEAIMIYPPASATAAG